MDKYCIPEFRGVGQLGKLQIAREEKYGVPGTEFRYFGKLTKYKAKASANYDALEPSCSRTRSKAYITAREYGFTATSKFTNEAVLTDDINWVLRGCPFTSFVKASGSMGVDMPTRDEYHGLTGCVLGQMAIASPSIAAALTFDMTVISQYLSVSPIRDGWSVLDEHFAPAPIPCEDGLPVTDGGNVLITIDGVEEEVPFKNWQVTVKNNSSGVPGYVGNVALSAGAGNVLGIMDIEVNIEQTSQTNRWNLRKWMTKEPEKLVLPLNQNYSIVMTDLYFLDDTMTEFQAGGDFNESINLNARTIEVL